MNQGKTNKEKRDTLRAHHEPILKALGIVNSQYCPHMSFVHNGEQYMKFFSGELNMKKDLYTESISRDFEPEDAERHLLVLKYGPHWKKYEQTEDNYRMYLVPVSDMELVNPIDVPVPAPESCEDMVNQGEDWELSEMTILDLAAILWRKPVSCKSKLNRLIDEEFNK